MNCWKVWFVVAMVTVGVCPAYAQVSLYEQPYAIPGLWAFSDTVDGSDGYRAYDDFVLDTASNVTSVSWWGGNADFIAPFDNPAIHDVLSYEIAIHQNDGGLPGVLVYSENVPSAAVLPISVDSVFDPIYGTIPYYQFNVTLDSPVGLSADTTYWLSIMAVSPTINPYFNWMAGHGSPGDVALTENLRTGAIGPFMNDLAFVLSGVGDSDIDGVTDDLDNCTLVANADQRDTDADGYGNACDPDLDNNGVVNFVDASLWVPFFNTVTNGDADFDGDGAANFADYALFPAFFLQPPGPSGVAP